MLPAKFPAGALALVIAVQLLAGCGSLSRVFKDDTPAPGANYQGVLPQPGQSDARSREIVSTARDCGADVRNESDLHLSLIEEMLDRGLFHAALAHLDALDAASREAPRARYLRAEALRRGGELPAARAVYAGLLETCLGGLGHFGLGRIAAAQCSLDVAEQELETARQMRPVDARVLNDLGMVHFARGNLPAAARTFQTAVELTRGEGPSTRNLLHVLVRQQSWTQAENVARRYGMGLSDIEVLRDVPAPDFGCTHAAAKVE